MSQAIEIPSPTSSPDTTLFVDLDGTLITTDMLWEHLFALLKRKPWLAPLVPLWILRGRSILKDQIARRVSLSPADLPYNEPLLTFLRERHALGQHLVLATASPKPWADAVANHLQLFHAVLASEPHLNLKGQNKLDAILAYNRSRNTPAFAYAGDSRADLVIWKDAREILIASPTPAFHRRVQSLAPEKTVHTLGEPKRTLPALVKALRPHQWAKNILVFVPILTSLRQRDISDVADAFLAFLAFCFCASGIYIINDLVDLASDRAHPEKRRRPFASGRLPLPVGPPLAFLLLLAAFSIATLLLPLGFALELLTYLVITILYSFVIKSRLMIDVITLAFLYTIRVYAGGIATDIHVSEWLMAFAVFFFLSLAFVKRYVELQRTSDLHKERPKAKVSGRGYRHSDIELVESMGPTAGYMSVLILALYLQSPAVRELYRSPHLLWAICVFLLYWISRIWFLAKRRELPSDPVSFALRDPHSLVLGVLSVGVVLTAAIYPAS